MSPIRIGGTINSRTNLAPVPNLRVEAWDKDLLFSDLVGLGFTDSQGQFEISLTEEKYREWFLDRHPDLYFKVYDGDSEIASTERDVLWNYARGGDPIRIQVDKPGTAVAISIGGSCVVRGEVRHRDGSPVSVGKVRAVDRDLRHEQLLGEVTPAADGSYTITYMPDQFRHAERGGADLVVRLLDSAGTVVASSPTLFNASPIEVVNLTAGVMGWEGVSEFRRVEEQLVALLDGAGVLELDGADLAFLSGESGLAMEWVEGWQNSHALAHATGLDAEPMYGLVRGGQPATLEALVVVSYEALETTLVAAGASGTITAMSLDEIGAFLKRLLAQDAPQPDVLLEPEVLYGTVGTVLGDGNPARALVDRRLNQRLRELVLEALSPLSERLEAGVKRLSAGLDYQKVREEEFQELLLGMILHPLRQQRSVGIEVDVVVSRLKANPMRQTVEELLELGLPLAHHGLFAGEVNRAKVSQYSRLAAVPEGIATSLLGAGLKASEIHVGHLQPLVDRGGMTLEERDRLLLHFEVGRLGGDNLSLHTALGRTDVRDAIDLAAWSAADWQDLIVSGQVTLPPSETVTSYAEKLRGNVARSLPTQVLLHSATGSKAFSKIDGIRALDVLLTHNALLIQGTELAEIDWSGVSNETRAVLEPRLSQVRAFANTYRHLGMSELINLADGRDHDKEALMTRRLDGLKTFFQNNRTLDLREADFFGQEGMTWTGIDEADQPLVRRQMMAYQRTMALSSDPDVQMVLLGEGFDSAYAVASHTATAFAMKSGLPEEMAYKVHDAAMEGISKTAHGWGLVADAVDAYGGLGVSNVDPTLLNDLREIDGWETLFGPQDYCECDHCKSIYSPAAYFTDLMYFIRQHVSKPYFVTPGLSKHPLHLQQRRSDLWTLQLTCENTNGLIPYLTVVNEVLESYLSGVVGNVWQTLADPNEKISFQLPFHLPLEELRTYLGHFGKRPYDIYTHLNAADGKRWRSRLDLSEAEMTLLTTPDLANVALRYGNPATFNNYNVQEFIRVAGIERSALDELLSMRTQPDLGNITVSKGAALDGLQNYPELLQGLTSSRLDRLHRLIRLWKKTPLSLDELDDLIHAVDTAGLGSTSLDSGMVEAIAHMLEVGSLLRFKPQELCSLIALMPVSSSYPVPPTKRADYKLFERAFDLKRIFGESDPNTHSVNLSTSYYHYSLNQNNPGDKTIDPRTPALLGGLGVTETELLLLCALLKAEIPFDADGKCTLDHANLSLLYRHARLARSLKYNVADFVTVLGLVFDPAHQVVETLDQVDLLRDFAAWQKKSPFSLAEIVFILHGSESASVRYVSDVAKAVALVKEGQASPTSTALDSLKSAMARNFGVSVAHATALWHWTATDVDGAAITTAASTAFDANGDPLQPADLIPLVSLLRETERVLSLFSNLKLKEAPTLWIDGHIGVFSINDRKSLTVSDLRELHLLSKQLVLNAEQVDGLKAALEDYAAIGKFSAGSLTALSRFWEVEEQLIDSVQVAIPLPVKSFAALQYTFDTLVLCRSLGINAYSLAILGQDDTHQAQSAASEVALGAFNSKYADEKVRETKLEPYLDKVNMRKRDALCDYIIARVQDFKFSDRNELYAFFLLDVDMGGCMRTSRVVAANGSLQLYVQRCLLNLEQSDPLLNPNLVNVSVPPSAIPVEEWEWRKNYRVWEANRKVFLYPENYIEPDLRDNKTPIFKELEDELLQQKITQKSAEAAYKKYLSQFAELARMVTAGSFYDAASNTYYFFAHTRQEPPQYYYRKWVDQKEWTPWVRMEVGINSGHLQGVVFRGTLYIFWMETKSMEQSHFAGGGSVVDGYLYQVKLCYSSLNENGKWAATQRLIWNEVLKPDSKFISESVFAAVYQDSKIHLFYSDKYLVIGLGSAQSLNLFYNALGGREFGVPWPSEFLTPYGEKMLKKGGYSGATHLRIYNWHDGLGRNESAVDDKLSDYSSEGNQVSTAVNASQKPFDLDVVGMRYGDFVLKVGEHQMLLRKEPYGKAGGSWYGDVWIEFPGDVKRAYMLSTSLPDTLGERLMEGGLLELFSLDTESLPEMAPPINFTHPDLVEGPKLRTDHVDFKGPWGEYYREIYFHIPFLIAHHLNANQKFKEAKWWYERVFDPTAADDPVRDKVPGDRNWRYIEFRGLAHVTMKQVLSDDAAIEKYKEDPFNPHAIARLRISAYQKTIVMHYIDNLLDWADSLFAQDTMESTNEAGMLYLLAAEILGKRPARLGKCESGKDQELVYPVLEQAIENGNEFLLYLENFVRGIRGTKKSKMVLTDRSRSALGVGRVQSGFELGDEGYSAFRFTPYAAYSAVEVGSGSSRPSKRKPSKRPEFSVIHHRLAFCIPPNKDLLAYWDRVEDRLYKLRNCLNISGVRRVLSLFAPEIDPRALVKAKASGLSLEDALAALNGPLPVYRFSYLLERARNFLGTVQGFGGSLLTALEKKDVEELTLLRSVHERNILRLTTDIKKTNIKEANFTLAGLQQSYANVQNRINYYSGLIDAGLTGNEITQQVTKHVATGFKTAEGVLHLLGAIFKLIPQIGSPFAMKYGGVELGGSADSWAGWLSAMSGVLDAVSASAGLEATFQRREQEWHQQLLLAKTEAKQMEAQIAAAELKITISERELEIHEAHIEQADEIHDFYKDKFTNLGLYNYLGSSLTRLYREAFNLAMDLARQAEKAFQYERDSSDIFIQNDNWQSDRAGLLAGERLAVQLMQMEKAWINQNVRELEMTQSFSMAFWNPDELLKLRQTGTGTFSIPEIAYDLFYPGQYRRKIKTVRLTIPCVVGPMVNVSAKLSLTGNQIRLEPNGALDPGPTLATETSRIATSTAQNDGGQFELNFRDERFLPFEGAGAVSNWTLELPSAISMFDYDTIGDVVIHVSYTALEDGLLRTNVESALKNAVSDYTNDNPVYRLFSMKHEFPNAFHQLLHPAGANQTCSFDVKRQHFHYLLRQADLAIGDTTVYLKPIGSDPVSTLPATFKVNGLSVSAFGPSIDPTLVEASVSLAGSPVATWTLDAGADGFDAEELEDILLLVKYTAAFS